MRSHFISGLIAVASLLGGAVAGPCKPSRILTLSTSTTGGSGTSTVEFTSSIVVDTTLSLTLDTTLSSVTDDAFSTTTSDSVDTTTDSTLSVSTDGSLSSTADASMTWSATTRPAASTTETTSSIETSLSSTGIPVTTEEAASTTEKDSTTTQETSTTATQEPPISSSEAITTAEVSTTTSEVSTTITEAATTTNDVPPVVPTFALQAANSARQNLNGQMARYVQSSSSTNIYLSAVLSSSYVAVNFHIETSTNRLMVGDMYASLGTSSTNILAVRTANTITTNNYRFISCTPPVFGQKLECVVEGTSRNLFLVVSHEQMYTSIYLVAPGSPPGATGFIALDLIVVPVS